jgi:hypothetical protein
VKVLQSTSEYTAYQRAWFQGVRARAAAGEPIAYVNADVPQEIFRAMDIPYVVNQWWASVIAAKQLAPRALGFLRKRGYPDTAGQYSVLGLGASFETDSEQAPWGGLPRADIVVTTTMGNASRKQFELWSLEHGSAFYCLEKSENGSTTIYPRWWERIDRDWEELIGKRRLDLLVDELKGLIRFLEQTTGRRFDETRFRRVMDLVNEQAEYNRRTRDLIARTRPAPVSIVDTMPATMIPQWHRGTEWARDAAKAVYEEVRERAARGESVCPSERLRLAWIGTGLWFNMRFYEDFQERFGAVFVWSIYLGIAADGYIRYGDDPLRALAARFTTLEEALHLNTWSSEWHVKECLGNQVDGVVTLEGHGGYFSTRALHAAGIPVLALRGSNVDSRGWDDAAVSEQLAHFLETEVAPAKLRRG